MENTLPAPSILLICEPNHHKEVIMKKEVIHTDKAPKAIGPYSQAIRTDSMIYTAGQLGLDPTTG
jgi:hypothetical protein